MFRKIVVAYNEAAEAHRALAAAILLAKSLNAELQTVTAVAALPAYTAFADVADPGLPRLLEADRLKFYEDLENKARAQVESHGIRFENHFVEGNPVEAIVDFLRRQKADLLVIGLHQREFYISRLWSTVYELAQDAPCSVLGVH
ncbi:MAG TPA: universal stress protein [Acidobacteriaceae bacterium]|nr:universal stress protein [Acidobacteriaceae bacterium]